MEMRRIYSRKFRAFFCSLYILLFIAVMPSVKADMPDTVKLLAVSIEENGSFLPLKADLELEIKLGSGKVFMETIPFSALDTQMSTRLAKQIACSYLDIEYECSKKDFFYTIKSPSSFVGGPSAGAVISTLTVALLKGLNINQSVSVTGSINSGGFIGMVSGLKEKVEAASLHNIQTVLIPKGSGYFETDMTAVAEYLNKSNISNINMSNQTIPLNKLGLYDHGQMIGVNVKEVLTFDEVIFEMTGYKKPREESTIIVNKDYARTMEIIRAELCGRGLKIGNQLNIEDDTTDTAEQQALDLRQNAKKSLEKKNYYSSASFCFGANIYLRYIDLLRKNITDEDILTGVVDQREILNDMSQTLDNEELITINDLQTRIIVSERLSDADERLKQTSEKVSANNTQDAIWDYAFAIERIYSAKVWSRFFDMPGKAFELDEKSLEQGCIQKAGEARERIEYAEFIVPVMLDDIRKQLELAREDSVKELYDLCLFKASKAKAEADVVISAMSMQDYLFNDTLQQKMDIVSDLIAEQQKKGIFPILGYSYLEYAKSLFSTDQHSSRIFTEYALEFSNLDMYFRTTEKKSLIEKIIEDLKWRDAYFFGLGAMFGALMLIWVAGILAKDNQKKKHKVRKKK